MALIDKLRFIFISLLCLERGSMGQSTLRHLDQRSKVLLPAQRLRRGLAEAVSSVNPATVKKFRSREPLGRQ
jgi:hypothetical protein